MATMIDISKLIQKLKRKNIEQRTLIENSPSYETKKHISINMPITTQIYLGDSVNPYYHLLSLSLPLFEETAQYTKRGQQNLITLHLQKDF